MDIQNLEIDIWMYIYYNDYFNYWEELLSYNDSTHGCYINHIYIDISNIYRIYT